MKSCDELCGPGRRRAVAGRPPRDCRARRPVPGPEIAPHPSARRGGRPAGPDRGRAHLNSNRSQARPGADRPRSRCRRPMLARRLWHLVRSGRTRNRPASERDERVVVAEVGVRCWPTPAHCPLPGPATAGKWKWDGARAGARLRADGQIRIELAQLQGHDPRLPEIQRFQLDEPQRGPRRRLLDEFPRHLGRLHQRLGPEDFACRRYRVVRPARRRFRRSRAARRRCAARPWPGSRARHRF
jgi:hypothetical protein